MGSAVEEANGKGRIFRIRLSLCPGFWDTPGWLGISANAFYPRFHSIILLISPWWRDDMVPQQVLFYNRVQQSPLPWYLSFFERCYFVTVYKISHLRAQKRRYTHDTLQSSCLPILKSYWPAKQFKTDIQVHAIIFCHCFLFASAGTDVVWMVFAQS